MPVDGSSVEFKVTIQEIQRVTDLSNCHCIKMSEIGKKGWRDLSTSNSFSGGYDNCTGYNASSYGTSTGEGYQTAGEKSSLMSGNGSSQIQNDDDWKWGNNQKSPSSHSLSNEWESPSWNSAPKSKVTSPKETKKSKRNKNDTQEGLLVNLDEQNCNKNDWGDKKEADAWESLNN